MYHLPHDSGQSKCLQVKLFNNTSNRPKGCNLIKKETLAQMFSCEFCEISRNNFLYVKLFIWATAFGLSLVNPRKKSMKELV